MLGLEAGNTMNHTMEHLKIKFIFIFDKINSIDHPVEITRRHSMVFLFCQDTTGVFFCATDVGFGGWENIWEIIYHGANVTKYVGLEPLRPSSIINILLSII
jgi:hypothetical protein